MRLTLVNQPSPVLHRYLFLAPQLCPTTRLCSATLPHVIICIAFHAPRRPPPFLPLALAFLPLTTLSDSPPSLPPQFPFCRSGSYISRGAPLLIYLAPPRHTTRQ
ncbi:hypothetical protein DFH07DRAFT_930440 [Mycena maculata]|uniref:Uncharacterized protein n=1 Tax=Mycena maculata TaxID=230809 RepID=A0AAD7HUX3_9AGAR|nr:hypothetical protein DFH07DRAFT_930440 [Mycena maculata]